MAKNKMQDLRNHLFEALEKLRDGDMEVSRANAICNVADKLIDSLRVELKYHELAGQDAPPVDFLTQEISAKPSLTLTNGSAARKPV